MIGLIGNMEQRLVSSARCLADTEEISAWLDILE